MTKLFALFAAAFITLVAFASDAFAYQASGFRTVCKMQYDWQYGRHGQRQWAPKKVCYRVATNNRPYYRSARKAYRPMVYAAPVAAAVATGYVAGALRGQPGGGYVAGAPRSPQECVARGGTDTGRGCDGYK